MRGGFGRRRNPTRNQTIGLAVAGVLALLTLGTAGIAAISTHSRGPVERQLLQSLANKWGPFFGAPPSTMMAIGKIESGWRPDTVNWSLRSIPLGGAWGPWQMTRTTARDYAGRLSRHTDARVRAIANRWSGSGRQLIDDPELAAVLTAAFLGSLTREFGSFEKVAGAYHQGAGKIRAMLKAHEPIPSALPPKGKQYVAMALDARKAIAA